MSRVALANLCFLGPAAITLGLSRVRIMKKLMRTSPRVRSGVEFGSIGLTLLFGLPFTIGIFEPVSKIDANKCESKYHEYEYLYFDKGL